MLKAVPPIPEGEAHGPPVLRRISPLRPGYPPGIPSRHTPPWLDDTLRYLAAEIRQMPPILSLAHSAAPPEGGAAGAGLAR